ncbi:hypothetical protein TNCV_1864481 [Trichonephila clavipes]|nr:hypothetical protein TNCV_1864481 [Trichonephila clavipes]
MRYEKFNQTGGLFERNKVAMCASQMALSDLKAKKNKEIADRKELSVLRAQIADKFQRLDNCQLLLSEELLKEKNGRTVIF